MRHFTRMIAAVTLAAVVLTGCAGKASKAENTAAAGGQKTAGQPAAAGENAGIPDELQIDWSREVDEVIAAHVEEAYRLLRENGSASEEIWPGYDLSQNSILVCQREDATNNVIHAWELTTTEKKELTNEQLAGIEIPKTGTYIGVTWEGKKSIAICISSDTLDEVSQITFKNFVYEVGVHENFHFNHESFLKLLPLVLEQKRHGGRGTDFPKAAEPRVYRKMLYDNLVAVFEHPEEAVAYLGKAKYWNEKWKTEYPKEVYQAKILDIMEGKARYIQNMFCVERDASEEEKAEQIASFFDRSKQPFQSIDAESYRLGFAAGVLLDKKDPDWKVKITKKPETPVDYLLRDVEMITDDAGDFAEKLEASRKQMAERNREIEEKLTQVKAAEADSAIPFLEIKDKYLVGSFETSDFINYMGKSQVLDFGGIFENANGTLRLKNISVYEQSGYIKSTYLVPLTMEFEYADGQLVIRSEQVDGEIRAEMAKDRDGRVIYKMK